MPVELVAEEVVVMTALLPLLDDPPPELTVELPEDEAPPVPLVVVVEVAVPE